MTPSPPKTNPMGRFRALRYVGGKIRIVPRIAEILHATEAHTLVDVFGGSGAITMNSGFTKRVYNDVDSDVVNFFRVLQSPRDRRKLRQQLQRAPMSRELYDTLSAEYLRGGLSFRGIACPIARAAALFYRSSYAFGGKIRSGGFGATTSERIGIKEIRRFKNVLEELNAIGEIWQDTVIEHLDFRRMIKSYGHREGIVLYCDPPYFGTEGYYSSTFGAMDHMDLALALNQAPCAAAVSYYDTPEVRDYYPEERGWVWHPIIATKNSMGRAPGGKKETVNEYVIVRNAA